METPGCPAPPQWVTSFANEFVEPVWVCNPQTGFTHSLKLHVFGIILRHCFKIAWETLLYSDEYIHQCSSIRHYSDISELKQWPLGTHCNCFALLTWPIWHFTTCTTCCVLKCHHFTRYCVFYVYYLISYFILFFSIALLQKLHRSFAVLCTNTIKPVHLNNSIQSW